MESREMTRREKVGMYVIIALVIACIILGIMLGIFMYDRMKYKTSAENVVRHAYYLLTDSYMNIETNLAKVKVVHDVNMLEEILEDVTHNARLAGVALSTMNTENNNLTSLFRLTNQVGDYTRYITKSLERGAVLNTDERDILDKMHALSRKVGEALSSIEDEVNAEGYKFVDNLGGESDTFGSMIAELNEGTIEYPALIYDGPFSDGLSSKKPKNLTGNVMSKEQCIARIREIFEGVRDVKYTGVANNKFDTYMFDITHKSGMASTVQMTRIGGHIAMFTSFTEQGDDKISEAQAVERGSEFLTRLGYRDMAHVYVSLSHGTYYINYAPIVDSVIYYPDLIKVKVSSADGSVLGMESLSYIFNHTTRTVDKSNIIDETRAISKIESDMDISSVHLALIPLGNDSETLTYEVVGTLGESRYYIYIDAVTGVERNVLMEIASSGGNLLI